MASYEVAIVGGGPAGLSAALILGRCGRRVLVCDSDEPRNARSHAIHGFLTRDGESPDQIRRIGRDELRKYPSVEWWSGVVETVHRRDDGFELQRRGELTAVRKLLLATGVVDVLPSVPGFEELYGQGVYHCPYCDGWELRGRPLAVYGRGKSVVSMARVLTSFSGDIVLCTDAPDDDETVVSGKLATIVRVETDRLDAVERAPQGVRLVFRGRKALDRAAVFFTRGRHQHSALASQLGCTFDETGLVQKDELGRTGVAGLFVAGDAARSVLLAIVAASEGTEAAFAINKELLTEEFGD